MKPKTKLPALTQPLKKVLPVTSVPRHKIGKPRGFAAMKRADVLRIAALGGKTISKDRKHMALIGGIGGMNSHKQTNGRQSER